MRWHKLKVSIKVVCAVCSVPLRRTKSFKVQSTEKHSAVAEVQEQIAQWKSRFSHVNCRICQSIVDDVAADANRAVMDR